ALNSGVKDRRARGFFGSMASMMGIHSGATPLMVDVRQTGASPHPLIGRTIDVRSGHLHQ
ncbi:MAG: hypothetical protein ACRD2C_11965, partial [Acidimicrobiales bacterium]